MGRPARLHSGLETPEAGADRYMDELGAPSVGTRQMARWCKTSNMVYPTPNGYFDPLTVFNVLFEVMALDSSLILRASAMTEWLQAHSPRFAWDPVTVGKVLSDLCDNFEDRLGAKCGILERGRDWKGNFYYIHRDAETAELAHRVLDDLQRLVEDEMSKRVLCQKVLRDISPLVECPSLREGVAL